VSASVNLSLHHKVQKFSSGTGSPGWSQKRGRKTVVVVMVVTVLYCFAVVVAILWMSVFSVLSVVDKCWPCCDGVVQEYRDGESAPGLTREPQKEHVGVKKTYYDSVQVTLVFCGSFTLLTCNLMTVALLFMCVSCIVLAVNSGILRYVFQQLPEPNRACLVGVW